MTVKTRQISRTPLVEFPQGEPGVAATIWYVRETLGVLPVLAPHRERLIKQVAHKGELGDLQGLERRERPREDFRLYGLLRSAGMSDETLDRMYATVDKSWPYYWNSTLFRPTLHVTDSAIAAFSQKEPQKRVDAAVALASALIFANLDALAVPRQVSDQQTVEQVRALFKHHARQTLVGNSTALAGLDESIEAVFDRDGTTFSFRGAMLLCLLPGQSVHHAEYVLGRTLHAQTIFRIAASIREYVLNHLGMTYRGIDSKRYCQLKATYQLFQNIERKYVSVGIDHTTAVLSATGGVFDPGARTSLATYDVNSARFTEEAQRLLLINYLESSIPYWFLSSPTAARTASYPV